MANERDSLSGAEEYVELEIELAEPLTSEQERDFRSQLGKIAPVAFQSCDIIDDKISLCYDPARTNQHALLGALSQSGGKLKRTETEISPLL